MKDTGDLVSYPTFNNIEIYITMKNDFTPVKIVFDVVYMASKPIIVSGTCTQHVETVFENVDREVVIPNLDFYTALLGKETEKMEASGEGDIKNDLFRSLDKLNWSEGIDVNGKVYTEALGAATEDGRINLSIGAAISWENSEYFFQFFLHYKTIYTKLYRAGLRSVIISNFVENMEYSVEEKENFSLRPKKYEAIRFGF